MDTPFPFTHFRNIIFGDTDPGGIVYTPRFSDYCMEAVEVWLDKYIGVNWAQQNLNDGLGTPVAYMETNFIAPLMASDKLGTKVLLEKIGGSSITVKLEGIRYPFDGSDSHITFTAKYVFCFVDRGPPPAPTRIPDQYRKQLEKYMAATQDSFSG